MVGILDFGDFGFRILDFGDFGFWILGPESQIQNPKFPIQTFLAKIWGFWILDFGSLCSKSACEAPMPQMLDFGGDLEFWIFEVGDSGVWILAFGDFGFWTLGILDSGIGGFGDFGFWILGILDFGF